jgi:GNAT superfamily N-acetyltransferase
MRSGLSLLPRRVGETAGRQMLRSLKASVRGTHTDLGLAVGNPIEGFLRPVATTADRLSLHDVSVLTDWRNRFVTSFLTEFVADNERTARWLVETVGPDDTRVLFMVDDVERQTIGYAGLAFIDWQGGSGEADAVVRGLPAAPGLMRKALLALLGWAQDGLGLTDLSVRVRSDNPAVAFYRNCGFEEAERVGLRRVEQPGLVQWVPDETVRAGGLSLVRMKLSQEARR